MLIRLKKENRGQALVELALVLPILLLLVFGIVEFGRIFGTYLMVTHGAREGARAAAVGTEDTEIISLVKNRTSALQLNDSKVVVNISPGQISRVRGNGITVKVEYPVQIYAPFISVFTGGSYKVSSQVTMRYE
ncbi:TadE/TadG family type IV pilus assembly protein [Serpentinicella alkaliphila]|uniref:TadE-like protein n=1 Tax=Serpentinicella alkaliphila TaxID=1734049 RepID=A0A4V2T3L4_9FIRM|nr:TadE/TadG family type IV pilus assembly protein [Serpentinicella alkaliphila]QUH27009.1 pilus assembly protein [Serpentinicella alkaliphila]TCQ01504.1 TadE-like protein [Serpentinicella alkaliphila]